LTRGKIQARIVADRLQWIERMLEEIRGLPLERLEDFLADRRNVWTAESCLRRAIEALMDLGRHILARGFGRGVTEYKEIATALSEKGILEEVDSERFRILAGYRNRMVHFYHEITEPELYEICSSRLDDLEQAAEALRKWLTSNSEMLDRSV